MVIGLPEDGDLAPLHMVKGVHEMLNGFLEMVNGFPEKPDVCWCEAETQEEWLHGSVSRYQVWQLYRAQSGHEQVCLHYE